MIKILVILVSAQMILSQNPLINKSNDELSGMMGAKLPTFRDIIESKMSYKQMDVSLLGFSDIDIPSTYDSRSTFSACPVPVRNQGQCGSCWAFASSTTFNFNLCAASDQVINYAPSMQQIIDCVRNPQTGDIYGCNGGLQRDALRYMAYNGVTNNACMPYEGSTYYCRNYCSASGEQMTNQKCSSVVGRFDTVGKDTIKRAILKYGAVTTGFIVYEDLVHHSPSDVYQHTWGSKLGGHAITVIGWGHEDGKDYWLTQNSWGPYWGDNGYWKHYADEPSDAQFFGMFGYWYCAQQQSSQ